VAKISPIESEASYNDAHDTTKLKTIVRVFLSSLMQIIILRVIEYSTKKYLIHSTNVILEVL
jgi:hypothetical protein